MNLHIVEINKLIAKSILVVSLSMAALTPATADTYTDLKDLTTELIAENEDNLDKILSNAEQGDIQNQILAGIINQAGISVEQDYKKAMGWYMKAAFSQDVKAQYLIGFLHDNGFGVKQDHNAAFEWFKRAADQGDPWGQIAISRGYFKGLGVKQDYAKAIEWAQKGAAQDHAVSQLLLALYYSNNKTGFKDLDKSKKWAEASCRNGNDDACKFILSTF